MVYFAGTPADNKIAFTDLSVKVINQGAALYNTTDCSAVINF
ncbi:hypothetical protein LDVICp031 [lymphocystis disease virus-China]|uniref:Uncharacterized protein n=1 Tax=lymphocystis disease virus-China TaxID=256729 RepID=Q678H8_9VIRU|nr:hypothetical protein LDVICp031 [lymphocystis disease virus-China]AAU10879.1 hypothetical protein [lymphocystis disease virus-China]